MKGKRKLAALAVAAAVATTMPFTAYASSLGTIADETTEAAVPSDSEDDDRSSGAASTSSVNGIEWTVTGDDDPTDESSVADADNKADINVWAKISGTTAKVYKIDIEWGALKFEFDGGESTWDVTTHTYVGGTGTSHWVNNIDDTAEVADEVGANGTNNKITVTNHSNGAINAAFAYSMVNGSAQPGAGGTATTPFNDGGTGGGNAFGDSYHLGVDGAYTQHDIHDVIGYFYGNNDDAAKALAAIAGTYDAGGNAVTDASSWQKADAAGTAYEAIDPPSSFLSVNAKTADADAVPADLSDTIVLPTADFSQKGVAGTVDWTEVDASDLADALAAFHDGDGDEGTAYANGARSASVYFAFSGQPDDGQGGFLAAFTKVGTITVTITPNDSAEYNTATTAD